ncbi:MAG: GTPase domain-containing protein [Desulfatiglandales bacterium]
MSNLPVRLAAFQYKCFTPCLWIAFIGGTGTGKSTLFNALCGRELSLAGVERPKTQGPVAHVHASCPLEDGFPFEDASPVRRSGPAAGALPEAGEPGRLVLIEHELEDRRRLVIVDTPDLDSLDEKNRRAAGTLSLLADAVVFVTSQEKYADEVPSVRLQQVLEEEKPVYFLLNKADNAFSPEDALGVLAAQGISPSRQRFWIIHRLPSPGPYTIADQAGFRSFQDRLFEDFSPDSLSKRRKAGLAADANRLEGLLERLLVILEQEDKASVDWLDRLETLLHETAEDLFRAESEHFTSQNRLRIGKEIRRLFSRYDLLARPRRAVRDVILTPFRLLGLDFGRKSAVKEHELQRARKAQNLAPMLGAVDRFNRRALEALSPADQDAPLFTALRRPGIAMEQEEVEARMTAEQERMEAWLRETFEKMAEGLPMVKKWSIYSTSIVWGVLVIALEATLGGGFTVIDALLGSALAPFLTKGSADLFAFREIRKVVREMAETYRKGLLSILEEQRRRYESALQSVQMGPEEKERLAGLRREVDSGLRAASSSSPHQDRAATGTENRH